ncbi:BRO family protein [Klebsiella aerogenes]|uniref:BRO family protein n=1 Tax=Klebsiella aerogenes TaxID=548 RepID=UPI00190438EC|nr:BRO family protein [Klebsiella aerogenes]MBK0467082.1 hypothetical protein [Klebsiella aerogenes]HCD3925221.1 hypothetical protein [Klebsiella aerogenes]
MNTTNSVSTVINNTFESLNVRVVMREGEPWFIAKDVAEALGYTDTNQAIRKNCKRSVNVDLRASTGRGIISAGNPTVKAIPESDVYRLIMRSRLASAERFEEWVVEEVLPSIRKNKGYIAGQESVDPEALAQGQRIVKAQHNAFIVSRTLLTSTKRSKSVNEAIQNALTMACLEAEMEGDGEVALNVLSRCTDALYRKGLIEHCLKRVVIGAMNSNAEWRRRQLALLGITEDSLKAHP